MLARLKLEVSVNLQGCAVLGATLLGQQISHFHVVLVSDGAVVAKELLNSVKTTFYKLLALLTLMCSWISHTNNFEPVWLQCLLRWVSLQYQGNYRLGQIMKMKPNGKRTRATANTYFGAIAANDKWEHAHGCRCTRTTMRPTRATKGSIPQIQF